jgi:hypothetical protein
MSTRMMAFRRVSQRARLTRLGAGVLAGLLVLLDLATREVRP